MGRKWYSPDMKHFHPGAAQMLRNSEKLSNKHFYFGRINREKCCLGSFLKWPDFNRQQNTSLDKTSSQYMSTEKYIDINILLLWVHPVMLCSGGNVVTDVVSMLS